MTKQDMQAQPRAKHTWSSGETITAELLNALETSADTANTTATTAKSTADAAKNTAEAACPKSQAATKQALGLVKQAAMVAEAAGENVTQAEFKALLDALKAAGIMASA